MMNITQNKKIAFVDFDGTIINVYMRYYNILNDYLKWKHQNQIEYTDYIKIKLTGLKDHLIIKELLNIDIDIDNYIYFKKNRLENDDYLKQDTLIENSIEALKKLKEKEFFIEILSYRNNEKQFINQIVSFNLDKYVDRYTSIIPKLGKNLKSEYINKINNNKLSIVIGDSMVEINAAYNNGIRGFFVKTGLSNGVNVQSHLVYEDIFNVTESL